MTRPRGPLPPRVYWVRRLLVVGVLVALVVGLARLLGGGSDGDPADDAVATSGEPSSPAAGGTPGTVTDPATDAVTEEVPTTTPPAEPEGVCAPEDVVVTPHVEGAVAGSPVQITLVLTTRETPACYWTVKPSTTVVKVTSGSDDIWTTQHCPDALGETELVVRSDTPATTTLAWPAWRSGTDCTIEQWSLPGDYHVEAAPLAGEPTDVQFSLAAPQPEVIERTITPDASPTS